MSGYRERCSAPRFLILIFDDDHNASHVFGFTQVDVERIVKDAITKGGRKPKDVCVYERSALEPNVELVVTLTGGAT